AVESREIDRRLGDHRLVATEVALDHLGHLGDRDALWKAAADAARDQQIADLDLVGPTHVLDPDRVLRLVAHAAHEAAGTRTRDDHVHTEAGVGHQLHGGPVAADVANEAHRPA